MVDPLGRPTKSRLTPFSPLAAHLMWVLPSQPVAELRFAAAGKAAQGGFRDTDLELRWPTLQLPLEGTLPQSDGRGGDARQPPGD